MLRQASCRIILIDTTVKPTRFSEPSQIAYFGMYQTVPAKNRYGSVMKISPKPQTVQKPSYQSVTSTVPVHFVRCGTDAFHPVRCRCISSGVVSNRYESHEIRFGTRFGLVLVKQGSLGKGRVFSIS